LPNDSPTDLDAGDFGAWLTATLAAQRGATPPDVPCGSCTACCKASHFVHVERHERAALAAIPKALLFPAPGSRNGSQVMGFNEHGHCPMLIDNACSIYDARPRTCRDFDCRVYAAADVAPEKPGVDGQAKRWRFSVSSPEAQAKQAAVRAAARFIRKRADAFPMGAPKASTAIALVALRTHEVFIDAPADRSAQETAMDMMRQNSEATGRAD
jgi:hypothetical protein